MTHYETLGVPRDCDFRMLKRAYYACARKCHPDLFANAPEKTEMFRQVVEAFNVLSDPQQRSIYDASLQITSVCGDYRRGTIMDTDYDDTLEELIVGNSPPEDATLMTLFRDLERTLVFITWREACSCYAARKYRESARLFLKLVVLAPDNILYRVYLARSYVRLKSYSKAVFQYRAALNIGDRRFPPQNLFVVRAELEDLLKKKNPFWNRIRTLFCPPQSPSLIASDEQMIRETGRAMQRMLDSSSNALPPASSGDDRS